MTAPLLLITDDARSPGLVDHAHGPSHPERPERLRAIAGALANVPPGRVTRRVPAPPADDATLARLATALERVHTREHVRSMLAKRGKPLFVDEDTAGNARTIDCALAAAGAGVDLVEALVRGEHARGFALVRPPGHHAERDRAMGFCYFNNIAVAAAHAVEALGVSRVLIVDWDVHHGNGTQHIFDHRADVLVFNVHEEGNYPGTGAASEIGEGAGCGFTINVPLPPGSGDDEYARVFESVLAPAAKRFAPQLVLVSAGFDAHERDPLGHMRVTAAGFANLCRIVLGIAQRHAGGRLGLLLEGGYDLDGLSQSVRACVNVLME